MILQINPLLLGIIGTQEIIILLYIAIPVAVATILVRSFRKGYRGDKK